MKNLLVTIVVAALVAAGVAFWLARATDTTRGPRTAQTEDSLTADLRALESRVEALEHKGPPATFIHLTRLDAERCRAVIDDDYMHQRVNKHVVWHVRDDCGLTGNWRVELDFGDSSPFPEPIVSGRGEIRERATRVGDYIYKVWMRPAVGDRYLMIDPELFIEP